MKLQDRPDNDNSNQQDPETFVPDTQKVVQRHLQDENHEITEEEMKAVKISTDHVDRELDTIPQKTEHGKDDDQSTTDLDEKIVTPWDVTS